MPRKRILASDDSSVILLPQEVLDQLGVSSGNEVELSLEKGAVILRSLDEAVRAQKLEESTDAVLEQRKSAYERLAEGAKSLDPEAKKRLWEHAIHEDKLFHDRLNFFVVLEAALLGVVGVLYTREPSVPNRLLIVLAIFGVAVTAVWLFIQCRHCAYLEHIIKKIRDHLPEFDDTVMGFSQGKGWRNFSVTRVLALFIPGSFCLLWVLFLFFVGFNPWHLLQVFYQLSKPEGDIGMNWLDGIQSIGIALSILFVAWQIRVQIKQMKSTANSLLAAKIDEINRLMFEHPEVFPSLDSPYPARLPDGGDRRYHLMHLIFNSFEQVFIHREKYGFIDQNSWNSWHQTMTDILRKPYAKGHWLAMKNQYTNEFQQFIDEFSDKLKQEQAAINAPPPPEPLSPTVIELDQRRASK